MNKGFSLIELLVSVVIIAILILIGLRFYGEQKRSTYVTWTKTEMIDIFRLMQSVKSTDGHYHQFIYAMGYRPKGKVMGAVGTAADPDTICCDQYPDLGADPCSKNWQSGYLYYNCRSDSLGRATDNIEICDGSGYDRTCVKEDGLSALQTSDFSVCSPQPTAWCNCGQFTVGGITALGKELTLSDQRVFCEED